MIIIAIDGACRRNGKPDCLSAGSVFIKGSDFFKANVVNEKGSTNQRGELMALITGLQDGLEICEDTPDDIYLITDSEYVFNAVSKNWVHSWRTKGWKTAAGEPVKNKDLWEDVSHLLDGYKTYGYELIPFHVKGHLFPFGKVTAADIMRRDPSGEFLYRTVRQKIVLEWESKQDKIEAALQLFERNHGHVPPVESYVEMVICNTVSDLIAGYHADIEDANWVR